jgi:hypothetical protein
LGKHLLRGNPRGFDIATILLNKQKHGKQARTIQSSTDRINNLLSRVLGNDYATHYLCSPPSYFYGTEAGIKNVYCKLYSIRGYSNPNFSPFQIHFNSSDTTQLQFETFGPSWYPNGFDRYLRYISC